MAALYGILNAGTSDMTRTGNRTNGMRASVQTLTEKVRLDVRWNEASKNFEVKVIRGKLHSPEETEVANFVITS